MKPSVVWVVLLIVGYAAADYPLPHLVYGVPEVRNDLPSLPPPPTLSPVVATPKKEISEVVDIPLKHVPKPPTLENLKKNILLDVLETFLIPIPRGPTLEEMKVPIFSDIRKDVPLTTILKPIPKPPTLDDIKLPVLVEAKKEVPVETIPLPRDITAPPVLPHVHYAKPVPEERFEDRLIPLPKSELPLVFPHEIYGAPIKSGVPNPFIFDDLKLPILVDARKAVPLTTLLKPVPKAPTLEEIKVPISSDIRKDVPLTTILKPIPKPPTLEDIKLPVHVEVKEQVPIETIPLRKDIPAPPVLPHLPYAKPVLEERFEDRLIPLPKSELPVVVPHAVYGAPVSSDIEPKFIFRLVKNGARLDQSVSREEDGYRFVSPEGIPVSVTTLRRNL